MDERELREHVCRCTHQLWLRGLLAGDGGMLTAELGRRCYIATPPGVRRCTLAAADLACVDIGGMGVNGERGVAPEVWRVHRLAYQSSRPDLGQAPPETDQVRATVLVTPPYLLVLAKVRPGAALDLGAAGKLPVVNQADDRAVQQAVIAGGAALLGSAGLLVAGGDLLALLNRVEALEHAAHMEWACLGHC